ncbi:class I SAM-dependent methyltransferase [Neobacillus mesonae]|nr:class I SAM-dependent methyltransferase [Neobacillus mesonae]
MEEIKQLLRNRPAGSLLDIGTGTGKFIPVLEYVFRNNYTQITGIDTDIPALEQAMLRFGGNRNIRFIPMDVEQLQFENQSFDTVCISNTLHHLPASSGALNEALRVLKSGGLLLINEMFQDNQTKAQQNHVLYHHLESDIDSALGILHRHTFRKQEILDLIQELNVQIISTVEYVESKPDLKNTEELATVARACDGHVSRTIHLSNHDHYKQRGEEFKDRLYRHGILRATQLVAICIKR